MSVQGSILSTINEIFSLVGWPLMVGAVLKFLWNHAKHWEKDIAATKMNSEQTLETLKGIQEANAAHSKAMIEAVDQQTAFLREAFRDQADKLDRNFMEVRQLFGKRH